MSCVFSEYMICFTSPLHSSLDFVNTGFVFCTCIPSVFHECPIPILECDNISEKNKNKKMTVLEMF